MSSTEAHAVNQDAGNGLYDTTDLNWKAALWVVPVSVFILVAFTLTCLFAFRGYKDDELAAKASEFATPELNILHAKENEVLSQYKVLDPSKGRLQIPIARAMELIAQEHQNVPGKEWKPITDIYMEGAAFAPSEEPAVKAVNSGISIDNAPAPAKAKKTKAKAK